VLDLTGAQPRILRPGAVTPEQIERVIQREVLFETVRTDVNEAARSPGQHDVHYAPVTPAFRFEISERGASGVSEAHRLQSVGFEGSNVGVMQLGPDASLHRTSMSRVMMPNDPDEYARQLYAVLRELDALKLREIHIESPPDTAAWAAVRDRIVRATKPKCD
jgi:L-threonylcarbamoyladenylate synthase